MNYKEFTKKLRAIGCREIVRRGGGSHRKWFNPTTGRGTTISDRGQKDLKAGTISASTQKTRGKYLIIKTEDMAWIFRRHEPFHESAPVVAKRRFIRLRRIPLSGPR